MQDNLKQQKKKRSLTRYARYSAMGLQMAAIIILGMWGGLQLDKWLGLKKFPVFSLLLSLAGVAGAIYYFIKDFIKKDPPKKNN